MKRTLHKQKGVRHCWQRAVGVDLRWWEHFCKSCGNVGLGVCVVTRLRGVSSHADYWLPVTVTSWVVTRRCWQFTVGSWEPVSRRDCSRPPRRRWPFGWVEFARPCGDTAFRASLHGDRHALLCIAVLCQARPVATPRVNKQVWMTSTRRAG